LQSEKITDKILLKLEGNGQDLHRAFDLQQPNLCVLKGSQGDPPLDHGNLSCRECRVALLRARELRGKRYAAIG